MAKVRPLPKRRAPRHFIKQWRIFRGLTQEQLAERVGVTHGAISQLERGITNYTQEMLESLAFALQCEPADLIMRNPETDAWSAWAVFDNIRDLPETELRRVAAVIEAIRKTGT
jgi:transcriptional regulator with XRE-family HTH domain